MSDPDALVVLSNPDDQGVWRGRADGARSWLTYGESEQLRDHAGAFSGMMASQSSSLVTWQIRFGSGGREDARGRLVSDEFFEVLGVRPAIGGLFTRGGDQVNTPSAVISDHYWQRRFGRRPDVLGTTFTLRKTVFTIIGVAPRGFVGETAGQQPDLWFPLRLQPILLPGNDWLHDKAPEKVMWLQVFGRLKPGVTQAQAHSTPRESPTARATAYPGRVRSPPRRRRRARPGTRRPCRRSTRG